jgi:hypothetical protein
MRYMHATQYFVVVLCSILWTSNAAWGQAAPGGQPDFAAAKRHFKAGQEFLQMERFADAVVEFKKAYEITKDGLVMGQIADAYAKAEDFEEAIRAIKIYRESLAEEERGPADSLIRDYQKAIKDGRNKTLVLPSDESKAPVVLAHSESQTSEEQKGEDVPKKKKRLWTWVALGATGALAVSAIILGLNAQSKFDDLRDKCSPNCTGPYASEVDSVKTRATVTDVLWGTAAVAAITTGILFWYEGRAAKASQTETPEAPEPSTPGGGSEDEEDVISHLRVTPVVGGGTCGVSAGLHF